MKRCFIAIKIPADSSIIKFDQLVRNKFAASAINWVNPENRHLTLAFLGDISDEQVESIILLLNAITGKYSSFTCEIKGFGSFGSRGNPSVLFLGIDISNALKDLKTSLDSGLKLTGYILDEKPFHPHLTLGRVKIFRNQPELNSLESRYKDQPFLEFTVDSLILYESKLSASGPVYIPIRQFEFQG